MKVTPWKLYRDLATLSRTVAFLIEELVCLVVVIEEEEDEQTLSILGYRLSTYQELKSLTVYENVSRYLKTIIFFTNNELAVTKWRIYNVNEFSCYYANSASPCYTVGSYA